MASAAHLFFLASVILHLHAASAATPSSELAALLKFKASLTVPSTSASFFASWDPAATSPCNFTGVTCSSGAVTAISVADLNVSSSAAVPFASLCAALGSLTTLSLPSNSLSGSIAGVTACAKLTELTLAFNVFSGAVPDLSPLTSLRVLNLSQNAFSGAFPWRSLSSMPGLVVLAAGDNLFLDETPTFPEQITKLASLTALYLSAANIAGEIPPSIGNLVNLTDLELADNHLTGPIPASMAKLVNLKSLELYNNNLTGPFPPGFGKMTKLQYLDASANKLTGGLSEIRTLTKLVSLQLFFNGFSDEVPAELGEEFKDLVNLSLYNNNLSGELPRNLGRWSEFDFIDVSTNQLSGPIPPDMCRRGTMKKLLMLENRFSGEIPLSYGGCRTLTRFRVSSNELSGEVPAGIWALPEVEIVDLAENEFTGGIGDRIGEASSLTNLILAKNKFSGEIPWSIGDAMNLQKLDLSGNGFSGEIPGSIGKMKNLDSVNVEGNEISGAIPGSIGGCFSLTAVNFAGNRIAGEIPPELGEMTRLNSLDLSRNEMTGEIPASLAELKLSYLNLSENRLQGPVPAALAIAAYGESFVGNPGLCSAGNGNGFLRRCSPRAGGRREASAAVVRTLITCLLGGMAVLLAVLGVAIFVRKRREAEAAAAMAASASGTKLFGKKGSWSVKSFSRMRLTAFDEREIVAGVRDENLIGRGGSGNVYRVKLGTGAVVAVKHITRTTMAGTTSAAAAPMLRPSPSASARRCREFEAEVGTLSSVRHVNVVKLLCSVTSSEDGGNGGDGARLLVYEHLPNGSLQERLPELRWPERYEVAVGAARGLEYLHHGNGDRPILHRDVKSSNILLDADFKPRIADFGLAKILHDSAAAATAPEAYSSGSGVVAGTVGYMAPEYGYTRKVTEKSDVYSFGVVLLELVTGQAAIVGGCEEDIVEWVSRRLREKAVVVDGKAVTEDWEKEEAARVLRVAGMCTSRTPAMRPSMRNVVQMLEDAAIGREYYYSAGSATSDEKMTAAVEVKVVR
ncbi:receptor-like protein kinase HAIKU2 [Brachypodium distachyon]|uniref:non-specific serine/threonine protein kinase n=1 Tax=Brachypodium distachyon TaxID=15368 RepID=I1IG61_BRADI|nr:receptor-like protein kinase HAIKU2 [Brachypodium distachyon]KQJ85665.1 hypothetical protein BRADI_4g00900v3 [Brachypodium distachyon]|eukprot:XP_003579100.1 receptor-like protein kinase HAIKU2 [Brachypodium distachyon]